MKIFLTGSRGMVGKNVLEHPKASEYQWFTPSSSELDLMDNEAVKQYIESTQPDIVIHCAGHVGGIQANIKAPFQFFIKNLDIGRNVVQASLDLGIKKLLNLGSSCMYPRNGVNPLKEEQILQGELESTNEGYALAKVSIARMCQYINSEFSDISYKTLIPCNLYGRWDKFDPQHSHMIPAVIRKIHEAKESGAKEVEIWGDGKARREFMYVGDLADMIFYSLENFAELPELTNVGLGYDYDIKEYYQAIAGSVGYEGEFVHNLDKPVGMKQKLVDISLQTELGWKPKYTLEQGVEATYKFYLSEKNK